MKRQDARDARALAEPDAALDELANHVVGAAVEVHRVLGPGFLESVYEQALAVELTTRGIRFARQVPVTIDYKGHAVGEHRLDFLVGERLIVELKAVECLAPIHGVQVRSYLKARGLTLGLLINFNVPWLVRGIRRLILTS